MNDPEPWSSSSETFLETSTIQPADLSVTVDVADLLDRLGRDEDRVLRFLRELRDVFRPEVT